MRHTMLTLAEANAILENSKSTNMEKHEAAKALIHWTNDAILSKKQGVF